MKRQELTDKVKVSIEIKNKIKCGEGCYFKKRNKCNLFQEYLISNHRCYECINNFGIGLVTEAGKVNHIYKCPFCEYKGSLSNFTWHGPKAEPGLYFSLTHPGSECYWYGANKKNHSVILFKDEDMFDSEDDDEKTARKILKKLYNSRKYKACPASTDGSISPSNYE